MISIWKKALIFLVLIATATQVSADPLVKVEIHNLTYYESFTILRPNGTQNWIKMSGGTNITVPSMRLIYHGINTTTYTKGDKMINITTYGINKDEDYIVNYPFATHPIYYQTDSVTAQILGANDLASRTAYVYLIKTYPTELKNALSSAVDGNTQPLRNLLNNAISNTTITLNSSGDGAVSYGTLNPGDYVVVATLNSSTENNLTLISATAFEVLEHQSSLNANNISRSNVSDWVTLDGTFTISGGSSNSYYTYIAALINKTAFSVNLTLNSGGTKATTNLTANNAVLVDSFKIGGVGLNKVNATTVCNWIKDAFLPNTVSLGKEEKKKGITYDFSLPVKDLPDGDYYLNIAAWNSSNSSQRVVAFSQVLITISTVPTPQSLVKVEIHNLTYYESFTILRPNGTQNWIKMSGGTNITVPSMRLIYHGINTTTYTKGDKMINITTYGINKDEDYIVNYPFATHPIYYQTDSVTAQILGANDLASRTAYVYLIKTYPTELKNALSSAVDGNTQPLRNLLNNAISNTTITLNSSGDGAVSYGTLNPGDYVVVATLNSSTENNLTLISATAFEVLEHQSSLNANNISRSNVSDWVTLDGTFTISGGSSNSYYTYIAALINKTAFSVNLTLNSGGTKATTNLTANNAVLVDSFKIGGVGLNKVNATTVCNWIKDAFLPNTVSLGKEEKKKGITYDFSLPVKDLPDGDYYLNIAAWNSSNSSQRVVAFSQVLITISTVPTVNNPPTVNLTLPETINMVDGKPTNITITYNATDPNVGDTIKQANLWVIKPDGQTEYLISSTPGSRNFNNTYNYTVRQSGYYTVYFSAKDSHDAISITNKTFQAIATFKSPTVTLNVSPKNVNLNYTGVYEANTTTIQFNVSDSSGIQQITLEVWNITKLLTETYSVGGAKTYNNSTTFTLHVPGEYYAVLTAIDTVGNSTTKWKYFYGISVNRTNITVQKGSEAEVSVSQTTALSIAANQTSDAVVDVQVSETTTNETVNVPTLANKTTPLKYINITGTVRNVTVFSIKVRYEQVAPLAFMWNKTASDWENVANWTTDDQTNKTLIINITKLAQDKGMNVSQFLADPVFSLQTPDTTPPVLTLTAPSNAYSAESVTFSLTSNEKLTNATLYIDGSTYLMSQTDPTALNWSYTWTAPTVSDDKSYTYNVTAYDLAGNSNKTADRVIEVWALPNLKVKEITISPETIHTGDTVTITPKIANYQGKARNVTVKLTIDSYSDTKSVVSIANNTDTTVSFEWTPSSTGNYTVAITAIPEKGSPASNNTVVSVISPVPTPTPTATPKPPAGGGVGGIKPPKIVSSYITKYETARILAKNIESTVKVPTDIEKLTGVLSISLLSNYEVTPWLAIAAIKELPENVPNPPGNVYRYFELDISHTGFLIKLTTKINFKVPKDWMKEKGYTTSQIVLMEYHNGWRELKTEFVSEDKDYFYFKAETTSFSIFAITAKPIVTPTPAITPTVIPTLIPTPTPTVTPTPTPKPWIPGFEAIFAIVAILIAIWRRRR